MKSFETREQRIHRRSEEIGVHHFSSIQYYRKNISLALALVLGSIALSIGCTSSQTVQRKSLVDAIAELFSEPEHLESALPAFNQINIEESDLAPIETNIVVQKH